MPDSRPWQAPAGDRPSLAGPSALLYLNRLTTLGHLLDGMVHGVNNSLQTISGIAELMAPPAGQQADLARIGDRVLRARSQLEELLRLARPAAAPPGGVDLRDVLQQAQHLRRFHQRMARIGVSATASPVPCLVHGVAQHFLQVVLNLMINAEQAVAGRDGPSIELSVERVGAGSGEATESARCRVSVADSGPGVAGEHRALIFEPFFTTRAEAAGLGLTVARSLVEAAGGRLWLDPSSTRGARFFLELPEAPAA